MRICVNGTWEEAPARATLAEILARRGRAAESRGVAIAHNEALSLRSHWNALVLQEGDRVEIIHAVQGG
jgi:sulfur carrier protein